MSVEKNDYKPRVLFPSVEAGMGHIMPMRAISKAFEAKYGKFVEVICTNFYTDSQNDDMRKWEEFFVREVYRHNKLKGYGRMQINFLKFFKEKISTWYVMRVLGRRAYKPSLECMEKIKPDLVFSTHWSTAAIADALKSDVITISYCPDASMGAWVTKKADVMLISTEYGKKEAVKKFNLDDDKVIKVPQLLRDEVYKVPSKEDCRKKHGFLKDEFVIVLADGGYGAGHLGKVTSELLKSKEKITLVPVFGKNQKLYEQFLNVDVPDNIRFMPLGFFDKLPELINSADLFLGKAGASTMAEPCYLGVPIIITFYATPLERWNGKHYVDSLECAIERLNPKKAALAAIELKNNPDKLKKMSENSQREKAFCGAEKSADIIWEQLCKKFPHLKN